MPAPKEIHVADGRLAIDEGLTVAYRGHSDERLQRSVAWALRRWEERTGLVFKRTAKGGYETPKDAAAAKVVIECGAAAPALPKLGDDESYSLRVDAKQAVLKAPNVVGVIRGLETLLQSLQGDESGWFVAGVTINDAPRFPWRGLMLDVSRHWQPLEVILRQLDAMTLVKLNVLHFHLSDDQGFRVESKTHPELHQHGSDGNYFTQDQIRTIIAYAAERGIRVVPEFDIPGHATSWVVSHPELASAPGPYEITRTWGILDAVLDPTNEKTYALLEDFLGEMAALFPDPYFHIGGDENNGKQWNANPKIQAYIRDHKLKNNEDLHAQFNKRVIAMLTKNGKKVLGWDEILHPELPKDAMIHSWRGPEGIAQAAAAGHDTILSNGWYIDLCYPASQHYANDPLPAKTTLAPELQKHVLGGEAPMWAEWVTPETIDSRIWPRTAAIAERLWSPRDTTDTADMYRRLAVVSRRLEEAGLQHERNRPAMIRRLAGDRATDADLLALTTFIDVIEPVKGYKRGEQHNFTQFTPLGTLADCARPESNIAREFNDFVKAYLEAPPGQRNALALVIETRLRVWQSTGRTAASYLASLPGAGRNGTLKAKALSDVSTIALEALAQIQSGEKPDANTRNHWKAVLESAETPQDAIELPMLTGVKALMNR